MPEEAPKAPEAEQPAEDKAKAPEADKQPAEDKAKAPVAPEAPEAADDDDKP